MRDHFEVRSVTPYSAVLGGIHPANHYTALPPERTPDLTLDGVGGLLGSF